jgi:hypothetical protein
MFDLIQQVVALKMTFDVAGSDVEVPDQGFNVFGSLGATECQGAGAPANIYCLGAYKDGATNDTNLKASYVGRTWANQAPFDANAPGGDS